MPESKTPPNSAESSTDAPFSSLTPLERGEAWLASYLDAALIAEEYRWTQSHLGRFEAAAYLASIGKLNDAHRNVIIALFDAAKAREQSIANLFAGLDSEVKRKNLPPWLDNGLSYGDPDGALTSAILRAGEQCGVQGLDAWWTGIGDALHKAIDSGALQGMAAASWCFNVARSDSAIQLPSICAAVEAIVRPRPNTSPKEQVSPWITTTGEFDAVYFAFCMFASIRCDRMPNSGDEAEQFEQLRRSQSPDGYWKRGGKASLFDTAAIVLSLCVSRPPGWEDLIVLAIEWLSSKQNSDGSSDDKDNLDPGYVNTMVASAIRAAENALVFLGDGRARETANGKKGPKWDGRELWFDGIKRCKVKAGATNLRMILEAFEKSRWKTPIKSPLDGGVRRDAISALNKKQKVIRFFSNGDNRDMGWGLQVLAST